MTHGQGPRSPPPAPSPPAPLPPLCVLGSEPAAWSHMPMFDEAICLCNHLRSLSLYALPNQPPCPTRLPAPFSVHLCFGSQPYRSSTSRSVPCWAAMTAARRRGFRGAWFPLSRPSSTRRSGGFKGPGYFLRRLLSRPTLWRLLPVQPNECYCPSAHPLPHRCLSDPPYPLPPLQHPPR